MNTPPRLCMPPHVFVEAIKLTELPCERYRQASHPAVEHIATWWNQAAAHELRSAFGFMFYVRVQHEDLEQPVWYSGDLQEGSLTDAKMQMLAKPVVEAILLDDIYFTFTRRPTSEYNGNGKGWYEALDVNGGEGSSGGLFDGATGEMIETFTAYEALRLFPTEFPVQWKEVLLAASDMAYPS